MLDILMYISDQHAWLQQGYAGDPIVKTPNLDRIAAQGTVMQNCCTSYPLCSGQNVDDERPDSKPL